jgi:predicted GNAT family acetyltransferase
MTLRTGVVPAVSPPTVTPVRVLTPHDLADVLALINQRPIENVFMSSRARQSGLEPTMATGEFLGYFDSLNQLTSVLYCGASLAIANGTPDAIEAFADRIAARRCSQSIVGVSDEVMGLWQALRTRAARVWGRAREVRSRQLLMAIDHEPFIPGDRRVQKANPGWLDSYYAAAEQMYTDEVGVVPPPDFRQHIYRLMLAGRGFAIWDGQRVRFKTDVATFTKMVCQLSGVWVDPSWRGQGLSAAAVAQTVRWCFQQWPVVSLYVNDFNLPAVATYRRVGMRQVATMATVLY